MAELLEDTQGLESTTIGIYRTAATVKGGRRFSFGAMVVVGDRNGSVAIGYGKAPGVPAAIEKAQKNAKKHMARVALQEGTIPHEITGRFLASSVKLVPASPGTGVIAGTTVRAVLELAGVRDCLTKAMGSTNQKNLAKAVMQGLLGLRSKASVEELRGVELGTTEVEEKLEAGRRYAPTSTAAEPTPQGTIVKKDQGEKGKGRGGRGRGDGPKSQKPEAAPSESPAAKQDKPPAAQSPQAEAPAEKPADETPPAAGETPGSEQDKPQE